MKKKIAVTLILVLLIGILVGTLTGCDEIFKKNQERDSKQIVASLGYAGQTANIRKFELQDSFNAYAYVYVNYYQMTYEQAADYVLKNLAERELLVLFARAEIAKAEFGDTVVPSACVYYSEASGAKSLLNKSEFNKAIEDTNKDLLSALEENVKKAIQEDKANAGSTESGETVYTGDITDPVYIYFDSVGGSAVTKKKVQKGELTLEPTAPTKDGYTFYGWKKTGTADTEIINFAKYRFNDVRTHLEAVWKEYTAPRTEKPAATTTEETFDAEKPFTGEVSPKFFEKAYTDKIDFSDKDFLKDIVVKGSETKEEKLAEYIESGISEIKKNLEKQYKSYDYYLESQLKTLLISKLERTLHKQVSVTDAEIQAKYDKVLEANKEAIGDSQTKFADAIKNSYTTTMLQKYTEISGVKHAYGFVNNILLKLDQTSVNELVAYAKDLSEELALAKRDEMLKNLQVKVSNPDYKADSATYPTKESGEPNKMEKPLTLKDPMTDNANPYNKANTYYNKNNTTANYNQILSFEWVDYSADDEAKGKKDGWEIVYKCKEAPAMAYLLNKVPAFSSGTTVGIVEQIFNSLEQVKAAITDANHPITKNVSVYYMREVAKAWLYLVGDDSGAVNKDSNNGGLGYIVTPEGEDSSYLKGFTAHARALIDKGTASYYTASDTATKQDKIASSYVFDDSFIKSGTTENAYAGIFILFVTQATSTSDSLPMDYVISYGKTEDECLTVKEYFEKSLLDAKKAAIYTNKTNSFGIVNAKGISYFKDAYKSIYKGK